MTYNNAVTQVNFLGHELIWEILQVQLLLDPFLKTNITE